MHKDRAILFLAVGQTLVWAGLYYIFPALLLRWEQDLGWSKADLTAAITLAVLISAFASPLAGKIIDRGHGPILMAGSAVCGGLAVMLVSAVSVLWQFYLIWAVIGLTLAGCLYEPCFALITRSRGKDAKRSIILITLIAGFASTICFPLMHTLAENFGWRSATILFGFSVVILAAPLLWLGANQLEKRAVIENLEKAQTNGVVRHFLKKPVFWFLAIGFAFSAVVHGAVLHHLLPILDERGLSSDMAVLAASFIGPMQVAGRLAMMVSEKYTSHHSVTIAALMSMGLSVILLLLSGASPVFLSTFVILFGGAYGTISILRPLITRDVLGKQNFGAKSGALALPYLAGSAFAPYIGSVVWGFGGYDYMLMLLVVASLISCTLYIFAHYLSGKRP